MKGPLTTRAPPILLQQDRALIVLKHLVFLNLVALGLEKVSCPKDQQHDIVNSDQLGFSGTLRVDLLTCGRRVHQPLAKQQCPTSVTMHVPVHCK